VGTVVAWDEKAKRHEVQYHDEPGEEPVLERFWGKNPARYRYFGETEAQPASMAPKTRRGGRSQQLTQGANQAAQLPFHFNMEQDDIPAEVMYHPTPVMMSSNNIK